MDLGQLESAQTTNAGLRKKDFGTRSIDSESGHWNGTKDGLEDRLEAGWHKQRILDAGKRTNPGS